MRKQNLILIGFMGAGKTSVGTKMARAYQIPFIDTDQIIEKRAKQSITSIFATQGEQAFRCMETETLKSLLEEPEHTVISVGGGLPLREENRRLLQQLGTVIFLRINADTVCRRLKGDTKRPLLQGEDAKTRVSSLLFQRGSIYESAAHLILDVDDKTIDEIIRILAVPMKELGVLEIREK